MTDIVLPHAWKARPHQRDLFDYLFTNEEEGAGCFPWKRRALEVWHRRAGKDSCSLQIMAMASQMVVGTYWHMLPTLNQGRKVVWDGIDRVGRRMIDQAFPQELRASTNETDMTIKMKNGSVWQVVGSDNYNSLVGTNPRGVVFSEYSVADPDAWTYIRPILRENHGFAIFIYTPRGKNHGWDLYDKVKKNPRWHVSLLTIDDTKNEFGQPLVTEADIQEERDEGMAEEDIQQEYYCSFAAGIRGAYWASEVERAREENRIGRIPYSNLMPVHLYLDIGIDDATACWFGQRRHYESSPGIKWGFCGDCGSPLSWEGHTRTLNGLHITEFHISSFDDPDGFKPELHWFDRERLPWFEIHDDLPRYERLHTDADPLRHGPSE